MHAHLTYSSVNLTPSPAQAELKGLQDASSPSFQFAKDLIRHNLVCGYLCMCVCAPSQPVMRVVCR